MPTVTALHLHRPVRAGRTVGAFLASLGALPMDLFAAATITATGPIRHWDYIRLRREAAGLTIAQAASKHWQRPEHRADCERNMAMFERPGVTVKDYLVKALRRSFPIDPTVYEALQERDARYHPRLCRSCGWDSEAGGENRDGSAIDFVSDDRDKCSACAERELSGRQAHTRRIAA